MRRIWLAMVLAACVAGCATMPCGRTGRAPEWRGIHFFVPAKEDVPLFHRAVAEALAPMGVTHIVLEVDYAFAYTSHPELVSWDNAIDKADARSMAETCRRHGIELIPQFNCLGHQSGGATYPLLKVYPEFDETPWVPPNNEKIYCRSWCPLHPGVNAVVFSLLDELIDAFQPKAFHVGMDEVFLLADDKCPRCAGKNPAELFAKAVNDLYAHVAKEKGLEMLMWGDRLLDQAATGYNLWESSRNGTAPAIDRIPKDLIVCDWHYGKRDEYGSVPYFQEKGFRVWPASWNKTDAALALMRYSRAHASDKMLGHLCTTWGSTPDFLRLLLGEIDEGKVHRDLAGAAAAFRACMRERNGADRHGG